MLLVNINIRCRVMLTDFGLEVLTKRAPEKLKSAYWDGQTRVLTVELWRLMSIFGECMYEKTPNIPFVRNEVLLFMKEHNENDNKSPVSFQSRAPG